MSESQGHAEIRMGSERGFGFVFTIVFSLIGLYPLLNGNDPRWWSLAVAAIFLIVSLIAPKVLKPLNLLWFKFGLLLGSIIAPIVMAIVFFLVVTPIGLLMRMLGKDLLRQRISADENSFWIERDADHPAGSMKDQF